MRIWRGIPGWMGFYQTSRCGEVRSMTRALLINDPKGRLRSRTFTGKPLKQSQLKNGYSMVSLTAPNKKRYYAYVHDLVLLTWKGPKPKGLECCHRNGIRNDNRLANLRYGTRKSNAYDRRLHGKPYACGEQSGLAKLTTRQVRWIKSYIGPMSHRKLAARFKVSHTTIGLILRGQQWRHIDG